jgi:phosphate-selective porin OprO and OprP
MRRHVIFALGLALSGPALAQNTARNGDLAAELEAIRATMREQHQRIEEQDRKIQQQQAEIERLRVAGNPQEARLQEQRADELRTLVHEVLADTEWREALFAEAGLMPTYDRGFVLRSADRNFSLHIGGWIQPRYEYTKRSGDLEDLSSFYLRRVRLDIRGHAFAPELTFRVMSEFARTANLRDAWINYAFSEQLQVRMGQFTVPFQWHRYVSPRRQHFAERGLASETFGFPTGRDIGVALHGGNDARTIGYGVGFFDGAGRNVERSNSAGHMASGRLSLALLGTLPREESDLAGSEQPQLAVGAGLQGAWENEVRAWDLGRSPINPATNLPRNRRADWATVTGDVVFRWQGFSIAGDGYVRRVSPDDPAVGRYTGAAWGVTAGYFIVPQQYEIVGRYNWLRLDVDDRATRETEWGFGLNIYHRGHDWKTRLNFLSHTTDAMAEQRIILEHHLQF